MKNILLSLIMLAGIHASGQDTSAAEFAKRDSIAHSKHIHPLPLECAKIKAGFSHDTLVTRLYGEGLFDTQSGHGGARYFTDTARRVILKTVIGVDYIIKQVVMSTVDYPIDLGKNNRVSIPVAKNLIADPLLPVNIHWDDSTQKIIQAFGIPNQDKLTGDTRSLVYEDSYKEWKDVLFYSAIFEFRNNRLKRILLYNGE